MRREQHDDFWQLYDKTARPAIERACRSASTRLTDRTMDADEMAAWTHQRVWKLLERDAAPTFHDDPTPEEAIERLVNHAGTLARWAYMALSRKHWRREQKQSEFHSSMSRAERLSMVSTVGNGFEQTETLNNELSQLKKALGPELSAKIAASWPEKSERIRVAQALDATRPEDQQLIQDATDGTLKENTVQQMRSRARKRATEIAAAISRNAMLVTIFVLGLGIVATDARAGGEQTGGRGGSGQGLAMVEPSLFESSGGEQSGGRGGGLAFEGEQTGSQFARGGGGEQAGGRGG